MSQTMTATSPRLGTSLSLASPIDLNDLFVFHMHAMRLHYQDNPSTIYALPLSLKAASAEKARAFARAATTDDVLTPQNPKVIAGGFAQQYGPLSQAGKLGGVFTQEVLSGAVLLNQTLQSTQRLMKAWNTAQDSAVQTASANLQATNDTASFTAQMNAQRDIAKKSACDTIDQSFNDMIANGTAHPEMQQKILATANELGGFVNKCINAVRTFIANIVSQIVQWISQAVAWVEQAARDAANFFETAASDIVDFFSSIF